jgi:hypothetical protein
MTPPAPNVVATNAGAPNPEAANAGAPEKDPEDVIMEIYDILVRLEAKVDRVLDAGKSQKGGRTTKRLRR